MVVAARVKKLLGPKARRRRQEVRAPSEVRGALVRVPALVRRDHDARVLVRPLHPLLHRALLRRAPIVAPAIETTQFHSKLKLVDRELIKPHLAHYYVQETYSLDY